MPTLLTTHCTLHKKTIHCNGFAAMMKSSDIEIPLLFWMCLTKLSSCTVKIGCCAVYNQTAWTMNSATLMRLTEDDKTTTTQQDVLKHFLLDPTIRTLGCCTMSSWITQPEQDLGVSTFQELKNTQANISIALETDLSVPEYEFQHALQMSYVHNTDTSTSCRTNYNLNHR